jgi:hypothetical protein
MPQVPPEYMSDPFGQYTTAELVTIEPPALRNVSRV